MGIKLLLNCRNPTDATSFYRIGGPFNALIRDGMDLDIVMTPENPNWLSPFFARVAVFLRPKTLAQLGMIQHAKSMKVPVWVDMDDNLFEVPRYNLAHDFVMASETQKCLLQSLQMADYITVSTEELKRVVAQRVESSKRIEVLPNAIDMKLFKPQQFEKPRSKIVMWRGTPTHSGDIIEHGEAILNCHHKFPEWKWMFYGYNPDYITQYFAQDRLQYKPLTESPKWFIDDLQAIRAAVHIVPLKDNSFNRCKSNIAFMEAALAGSATVKPEWSEWDDQENNFTYSGSEFQSALESALNLDPGPLRYCNETSWNWIAENRSLQKINERRKEIILELSESRNL